MMRWTVGKMMQVRSVCVCVCVGEMRWWGGKGCFGAWRWVERYSLLDSPGSLCFYYTSGLCCWSIAPSHLPISLPVATLVALGHPDNKICAKSHIRGNKPPDGPRLPPSGFPSPAVKIARADPDLYCDIRAIGQVPSFQSLGPWLGQAVHPRGILQSCRMPWVVPLLGRQAFLNRELPQRAPSLGIPVLTGCPLDPFLPSPHLCLPPFEILRSSCGWLCQARSLKPVIQVRRTRSLLRVLYSGPSTEFCHCCLGCGF